LLDALHQLAEKRALRRVEIFLLVFVEEEKQMDMLSALQVEIHVSKSTTPAFAAGRIRNPRLSNASESFDHIAPDRIFQQAALNFGQHRIGGIVRKLVKPPGKHLRFDEYHAEIYTTLWYKCK